MIWVLPPPPPATRDGETSCWRDVGGRGGEWKKPNHTTARKPGPLYYIKYSYSTLIYPQIPHVNIYLHLFVRWVFVLRTFTWVKVRYCSVLKCHTAIIFKGIVQPIERDEGGGGGGEHRKNRSVLVNVSNDSYKGTISCKNLFTSI
jgi:hypothetical protein